MFRINIDPRPEWKRIVEPQGFTFHTTDDGWELWDERAYYEFSVDEARAIADATETLHRMCLTAVEHVIRNRRFVELNIPAEFEELIRSSWRQQQPPLYGRFDLAYDGIDSPKLLEYNADTPTALIESAVVEWYWLRDVLPGREQFNRVHDELLRAWRDQKDRGLDRVWFAAQRSYPEDFMTVNYLRDVAAQADIVTSFIDVAEIGWDSRRRAFVDRDDQPITACFKLYPWEWMVMEEFGAKLLESTTRWFEPPWKMVLSNKGILAILHELFPDSPHLLPAAFSPIGENYVRKPLYSREGANVQLVRDGRVTFEADGDYGAPYVYQRYVELAEFDGKYPIIGSWVINGRAAGIGVREDAHRVTSNVSPFVPHVLR